jgi:hypothetical protein
MTEQVNKIPANVRVMIAIVAFPTLLVLAFVLAAIVRGNWSDLSIGGAIFSALCIFAYFIVITGRLPKFFRNIKGKSQSH